MGAVFVIRGILIYIYGFDHNPPHIHVKCGGEEFSISIEERVIEGTAKPRTLAAVNEFIDENKNELMEIWEKAQKGEKIEKINR